MIFSLLNVEHPQEKLGVRSWKGTVFCWLPALLDEAPGAEEEEEDAFNKEDAW